MTSNDHTVVGVLIRSTSGTGTSADLWQVVGHIHLEAVQVVQDQTILQTRATEVAIQQTAVFVFQHLDQDWVKHQPTAISVHVLLVQQTTHTSDHHQWRNSQRRQTSGTRQTGSDWNRVVATSSDVGEATLDQFHRGQQFIGTSGSNSFGARHGGVDSVSGIADSRLLVARQIAKNLRVKLVLEAVASTVSCHLHEVDMRVSSFDIVHLEREVVSLVNNECEVAVFQILRGHLRATSIGVDGDLWLFDNFNAITKRRDFTEVVGVSDCLNHRRFTESNLYFLGIDNGRERAVREVAITGS